MREMFMEVSQRTTKLYVIFSNSARFQWINQLDKVSSVIDHLILFNIFFFVYHTEEDDMEPCASEALLKCTGFGKTNWPTSLASLFDGYFICLENTATACTAPIWQHLLITYEPLKEELNKNRDKFNELSLNVTQNP